MRLLCSRHPAQEILDQFLEHLCEECPVCREELESLVVPHRAAAITALVETSLHLVAGKERQWERLKAIAMAEFAELVAASAEERRLKVTRALSRFRNPALVDLLVEESRRRAASAPFEALDLAECAHDISMRLPHTEIGASIAMTCVARAGAYRANALRAAGQFRQAESLMVNAVKLFDAEGSGDPLVEAELMELMAVLRREQRQFTDAEGYLDIAKGLYERCQEHRLLGRVLVLKALVLSEAGNTEDAIATVRGALQIIPREAEPWLHLCGQHGLAEYLIDADQFLEARQVLGQNEDLYDRFPEPLIQLRRQWVEARIAYGLGAKRQAEESLLRIRSGFMDAGLGFETVLVGLDLALIYVEERKTAEVQRLAEEMMPVFMAQDIHREAAAALLLFQEAAQKEVVTSSMLSELTAYMRRIRARPVGPAS